MDLNQDLLVSATISIKGGSIPSVERSSVGHDQTRAPMVTFQLEEALETIPENEPTAERDLPMDTRRGEGVENPPTISRLTTKFQSINTVSLRGQRQPPREVKEVIATDLAILITNAAKNDNALSSDWVSCHPDPLSEEEEISERFVTTYPNVGTPGASTSRRVNGPFRILRTPSLSCMSWRNQGGFDKYFIGIDRHRYPVKDQIDKVDQIVRSPRNPGTSSNTIKVDPLRAMSLPKFKEYGSFIGHTSILAFAHGKPYTTSLNGCTHAQISAAMVNAKKSQEKGKEKIRTRASRTRKLHPP
uniref:Uncharacterized protein n=1 Tax=Cannabis sativa TaxID=3483 RepID=A0A803NL36_CANSA